MLCSIPRGQILTFDNDILNCITCEDRKEYTRVLTQDFVKIAKFVLNIIIMVWFFTWYKGLGYLRVPVCILKSCQALFIFSLPKIFKLHNFDEFFPKLIELRIVLLF